MGQGRSDGDAERQMANGTVPLQVQGAGKRSRDSEDPVGRCDDVSAVKILGGSTGLMRRR